MAVSEKKKHTVHTLEGFPRTRVHCSKPAKKAETHIHEENKLKSTQEYITNASLTCQNNQNKIFQRSLFTVCTQFAEMY